jgi:hypothetical protein
MSPKAPGTGKGMFHCLDDDGKRSYAAAAHRATRPGATLLISCFSDANPSDEEWPRPAVSGQPLRDVLSNAGWDIESLEPATWRRGMDGNEVVMAFWYPPRAAAVAESMTVVRAELARQFYFGLPAMDSHEPASACRPCSLTCSSRVAVADSMRGSLGGTIVRHSSPGSFRGGIPARPLT